jgi:hypothetical protein
MKKKPVPPTAQPAKTPAPVGQQSAQPQPDPAQTAAPAPAEQGQDYSETAAVTPGATPPPATAGPIKPLLVPPSALQPPVPGMPNALDPDRFKLTFDPPSLIDWSAMRQPFLTRGVPLGAMDAGMIEQNWVYSYNNMVRWGLSADIAAKLANIGTPLAYDFSMARDYPTTEERFDRELEKMLPPGQKLGKFVVPVITPDTLNWAVKQVTNKDIDFRF